MNIAGWSSLVARQAHNLKAAGSNPAPATNFSFLLGPCLFAGAAKIAGLPARKLLQLNPGMRVLIADDQKSVGATLADIVSHYKHDVVEVVSSGFEAIRAYNQHHPDVVLMDYWMSNLNGATACRNIVARDPSARVILVSGWTPVTDLSKAGAVAVLTKPVDPMDLEQLLKSLVQEPSFDFGTTTETASTV